MMLIFIVNVLEIIGKDEHYYHLFQIYLRQFDWLPKIFNGRPYNYDEKKTSDKIQSEWFLNESIN